LERECGAFKGFNRFNGLSKSDILLDWVKKCVEKISWAAELFGILMENF